MSQLNSYKTCRACTAATSSTVANFSHTCSNQSLLLIYLCGMPSPVWLYALHAPNTRRQLTAVDVQVCDHVHGEALNTLIVDQVACWMYNHVMILVRGIETLQYIPRTNMPVCYWSKPWSATC
jgi:hypothetical protein